MGKRFIELTIGLAGRGHHICLLAPEPISAASNIRFQRVPNVTGFPAGIKRERLLAADVAEALRRHRPEVAYAFGHDAGALGRACRPFRCPFVVFVRGEELVTVNNPHIPFRKVPLLGRVALEVYARLFIRWTRTMYERAAAIIFQHERQRNFYVGRRMVSAERAEGWPVLPNNCNPTWLQGHKDYELVRRPLSVVVGNLYWNKGFDILFEAFRRVRAACPEAELVVLGDGPDGAEIRSAARTIGSIVFRGHVSDVVDHLLRTRVFVFASQVEGGSPNAVLEAIEMGMPILCSSEVAHTVGDAHPGLFEDAGQLAELWVRGLQDDAFCQELMEESLSLRERYRFDWVGEAEQLLMQVARKDHRG